MKKMTDKQIKVLLIEDDPGDARLIRMMMSKADGPTFSMEHVERLSTGLERLTAGGIDVVLLDLGLPDSSGLDTFIKVHAQVPDVPIIMLTGLEDATLAIKAVQGGAQDYLYKNKLDGELLVRAIHYAIERKKMEEALRESQEKFRALVETTSDWIWEVDQKSSYTYVSPRVKDLLGYAPEEVLGKTPFDLMPFDEAERVSGLFQDIIDSGKPYFSFENTNLHKNGRSVLLETRGVPFFDAGGAIMGYRGIDRDITNRKRAENQIKKALKEKEVLLQEIHHRVTNNLQVVSSLLNMQARAAKDKNVKDILLESRNRVNSMALIHSQLYKSESLSEIDMKDFINKLLVQLFQSYPVSDTKITPIVYVADYPLPISLAVPVGLIVNELLANAFEHAFVNRKEGKIEVSLSGSENGVLDLTVSDDGVGLPEGFEINANETLGLRVVKILAEGQLDGHLEVISKDGTTFKIEFKI